MGTKLFVGNIPYSANDDSLRAKFETVGKVASASVISDRETGRSRGFGFVEMDSDDDAVKAVSELNGSDMDGRAIVVNEARPSENRGGGGGGGYDRGGY